MSKGIHPFEKNARAAFEREALNAARVLECDVSHVIAMASEHLRVLARSVENGRKDGAEDIRAMRNNQD